jgi:hypothetical protein
VEPLSERRHVWLGLRLGFYWDKDTDARHLPCLLRLDGKGRGEEAAG